MTTTVVFGMALLCSFLSAYTYGMFMMASASQSISVKAMQKSAYGSLIYGVAAIIAWSALYYLTH